MGAMAYQITGLAIVYSAVYSGADQIKHQSSAPLAFVGNSPVTGEFPRTKCQWRRKCFHLITSSWLMFSRSFEFVKSTHYFKQKATKVLTWNDSSSVGAYANSVEICWPKWDYYKTEFHSNLNKAEISSIKRARSVAIIGSIHTKSFALNCYIS